MTTARTEHAARETGKAHASRTGYSTGETGKAHALRTGYSTGACATALLLAAWRRLHGQPCREVRILFGDGAERPLHLREEGPWLCVTKDGGDDPDCTHGAVLYGRLSQAAEASEADERDYVLSAGPCRIILRAVEGIGLCTRPGLDCEPGKWAINTGPRHMMQAHLERETPPAGTWLFELGIRHGERLAAKTLNAQLGVVGGLSVLGTTGLVRPFSHDAYVATVQLCARSWGAEGGRTLVLCTGGRTRRTAEALLDLPEHAFVSIGDFIAESLASAVEAGMTHVVLACMPGKLCKYAAGFANTHAHRVPQDMPLLLRELTLAVPDDSVTAQAAQCASVREVLLLLDDAMRDALLSRLADLALQLLKTFAPTLHFRLLVMHFQGELLLDTGAPEVLS